jgi:signal transduction histidine kinase
MDETQPNADKMLQRQGHLALLLVVVIGYLVTFLGAFSVGGERAMWWETAVSLALGVVYVLLAWHDEAFLRRVPGRGGLALYFVIQLSLIYTIYWLIGPGGIWLVSLPLAGLAVEHLSPLWRWPVFLGILLGMFVPLGLRYDQWESAFFFAISVSPAIFFVAVFTQQGQRERVARQQAERLTADLAEANHQLAAYAVQAEELATTEERNRLAREIHDNLGHYLTVVNVQIGAARVLLTAEPERADAALDKAQKLTQEGLAAVRQSVAALRESPLAKRPLPDAIADLIQASNNAGIVTEFSLIGQPRSLSPQATLTLYRVAQEGLTNVRKHARASRADLRLDYADPTAVRLTIHDNGLGSADPANGFGLLGMRERVNLLGGQMVVETAVSEGFSLSVYIPTGAGERGSGGVI